LQHCAVHRDEAERDPRQHLAGTSGGRGRAGRGADRKEACGRRLDVYEREPAVHPGLISMPNVVLAPHIASATVRTRSEMSAMAARNMATAVRGGRPPNLVNSEVKK